MADDWKKGFTEAQIAIISRHSLHQTQSAPQAPTSLAPSSLAIAQTFNALGIETPPGDRPGAWGVPLDQSLYNVPAEQAGRIEQARTLKKLDAEESRACLAGAEKHLDATRAYCKRHKRWDPFESGQEFDRLMQLPPDHEEWTNFDRRQKQLIDDNEGERVTSAAERSAGPAHPVTNTGAARRHIVGSSLTGIRADYAEEWELVPQSSRSDDASSHRTVKWMRCADKEGSVPGGSSISSGFAGKVAGEALSASPISSGTAAKVGMVDGAESHAGNHRSAVPIACDFAATLQFLSDLAPDGKNKDMFVCRRCGFVAPTHLWHQARGAHGMKHHFRCRRCNTEYLPWKKDSRFCKFNKVLLNVDPMDSNKYIATPAWCSETFEQLFFNLLKEFTLKIQVGSAEMNEVTFDNITKFIELKVDTCYRQSTVFEQVEVPAPYTEQVTDLSDCKGYEHCDISQQKIEGFFFKNHMDVREDDIFKDYEVLCNKLASCIKMVDV